ncbi:MAG: ATP-binding cassette domain-containing protein [Proteobacteria bacterium]|nr:ATP-binding cassette domain-containing protein [Pseudomonadota bacterium]
MPRQPLIKFSQVEKGFLGNEPVFTNISLAVNRGEFLFLTGVSGAGKSTIFKLIMGLEKPDRGRILFNGNEVKKIPKNEMYHHRRTIGMVFQDYKLLEKRTAQENIGIPLQIMGISGMHREKRIKQIAGKLKIEHILKQTVQSLSGGEQQLVAIARAAVHSPLAILADEPTANLDQKMASRIVKMLTLLNADGITVIIATHDVNLIKSQKRRILLLKNSELIEVR